MYSGVIKFLYCQDHCPEGNHNRQLRPITLILAMCECISAGTGYPVLPFVHFNDMYLAGQHKDEATDLYSERPRFKSRLRTETLM